MNDIIPTRNRYHTADDGLAKRNPIPRYALNDGVLTSNPEWENAPFEEVIICTDEPEAAIKKLRDWFQP